MSPFITVTFSSWLQPALIFSIAHLLNLTFKIIFELCNFHLLALDFLSVHLLFSSFPYIL